MFDIGDRIHLLFLSPFFLERNIKIMERERIHRHLKGCLFYSFILERISIDLFFILFILYFI